MLIIKRQNNANNAQKINRYLLKVHAINALKKNFMTKKQRNVKSVRDNRKEIKKLTNVNVQNIVHILMVNNAFNVTHLNILIKVLKNVKVAKIIQFTNLKLSPVETVHNKLH